MQNVNLKRTIVSNYMPNALKDSLDFVTEVLNKFNEIKVIGAQEDEEIDSLEHVALYHKDKLFACSPSWQNKIDQKDKSLIHIYLQ